MTMREVIDYGVPGVLEVPGVPTSGSSPESNVIDELSKFGTEVGHAVGDVFDFAKEVGIDTGPIESKANEIADSADKQLSSFIDVFTSSNTFASIKSAVMSDYKPLLYVLGGIAVVWILNSVGRKGR